MGKKFQNIRKWKALWSMFLFLFLLWRTLQQPSLLINAEQGENTFKVASYSTDGVACFVIWEERLKDQNGIIE